MDVKSQDVLRLMIPRPRTACAEPASSSVRSTTGSGGEAMTHVNHSVDRPSVPRHRPEVADQAYQACQEGYPRTFPIRQSISPTRVYVWDGPQNKYYSCRLVKSRCWDHQSPACPPNLPPLARCRRSADHSQQPHGINVLTVAKRACGTFPTWTTCYIQRRASAWILREDMSIKLDANIKRHCLVVPLPPSTCT